MHISLFRVSVLYTLFFAAILLYSSDAAHAQGKWLEHFDERVAAAQAAQTHWPSPLITTTPRLDQKLRADFVRQRNPAGYDTWNLGNSKGVEVILLRHLDFSFDLPPFYDRSAPKSLDGFGDVSMQLKSSLYARNEQHGNAMISLVLTASLPTGKNGNGSCCALLSPGVAAGKGWGRFNVISYAGAQLPMSAAEKLGRQVSFNVAGEVRLGDRGLLRTLSPQLESNTTFLIGGSNDGKAQNFITPGVIAGRFHLTAGETPARRPQLTVGAGMQIAATHFHAYNHAVVLTSRLYF
jgi:hypothetical protein